MNESVIVGDLLEWRFQGSQEHIDAVLLTGHGAALAHRLDGRQASEIGDATARHHAIAEHPGQYPERLFRLCPFVASSVPLCAPIFRIAQPPLSRATRLCSRFHSSVLGVRLAIPRRSREDRSAIAVGSPAPPTIVRVSRDSTTLRAEPRSSRRCGVAAGQARPRARSRP